MAVKVLKITQGIKKNPTQKKRYNKYGDCWKYVLIAKNEYTLHWEYRRELNTKKSSVKKSQPNFWSKKITIKCKYDLMNLKLNYFYLIIWIFP